MLRTRFGLIVGCLLTVLAAGVFTAGPRPFPDTSARIAVLADQLPEMNDAQVRFAARHYVGAQKLTLALSRPLRKINPGFLVLHYHLAMWQSAPNSSFITDGDHWANDYPEVNRHESWFWHNVNRERVRSNQDGKLLMNVSDAGFRQYWRESIIKQVAAGDYDGVFLDSASPALLQGEASQGDPRLAATAVRTTLFPELGGQTWIKAWQDWIDDLERALSAKGIPLLPNVDNLTTTWDNTDYSRTAGVFSESFLDPASTTADWQSAAGQTLELVARNKIVILQNYLRGTDDVAKRKFLLAGYLLVKGSRTYINYFVSNPFQWYPEWDLDLGAARTSGKKLEDLSWSGIYRRDFEKGIVLVNPGTAPVRVDLGATLKLVTPVGGGDVSADGKPQGRIETKSVTSLDVSAKGAEILLR